MSGEMAVSLALKFKDQGSALATQAFNKIKQEMKGVGEAAKSSSAAAVASFQKLASAREILGIRSEKAIQNEIKQTEAAYNRMANAGIASARELGRAQDAMKNKVAELRREMEGVKTSAGGMPRALSVAMGAFGGYQAGKMVLSEPIRQTMGYDRALANLSNTAFAGQSMDARRGGMRTLDAAIVSAVRAGGGTREGALGTLDKLVASGSFDEIGDATRLLPVLTRAGTAANADPSQLADIAIRAKQTFGLKDPGLAMDQAIRAGQLGGFELKDMAKWLPQQMAMARQSGLQGDDGFRALLAANQASAITAGTKDEAGNNLVNLLAKINSQDTSNDAKKLGINLSGALAAARGKGVNSLDAFVNMAEQIVAKDSRYAALRTKAKTSSGDEQKQTYSAMGDIIQGSAIGKIVQDRQALMALVGIMNNRDYMNGIRGKLGNAQGAADDAFGLIAETPSYKAEQLAAEKAIAMQVALDKVNPALGSFADGLAGVMREWPVFSGAVSGATLALTALAMAAGGAALPGLLLGRGGAGLPGVAGVAGKALGFAGKATGVLGAFGLGYAGGTVLNAGLNKGLSAFSGEDTSLGSLVYDMTHGDAIKQNNSTMPSGGGMSFQNSLQPLRIENKIILDGRQVATSTNEINSRTANRH